MKCCSLVNLKEKDMCEVLKFGKDLKKNSRLFALGIIPGTKIKIIECSKRYFLISTGMGQIGLSIDMLDEIEVKLCH